MFVYRFLGEHSFRYAEKILKNAVAGSYSNWMFSCIRNDQIVFQSGCTILHFHQQWMSDWLFFRSCQHFVSLLFFTLAILIGVYWLSFWFNDVEHLFHAYFSAILIYISLPFLLTLPFICYPDQQICKSAPIYFMSASEKLHERPPCCLRGWWFLLILGGPMSRRRTVSPTGLTAISPWGRKYSMFWLQTSTAHCI